MMVSGVEKHDEHAVPEETDQQTRSQRIFIVLFFLAMLSAGVFLILKLLLDWMP
jgi:hypothetical protein